MGFSKVNKLAKPGNISSLSTPLIHLDFSLGRGIAEGRWIETFAPEGIGKTTLNLQTAGFITELKPNYELLYIDAEMSTSEERIMNVLYGDVEVDLETGAIFINNEDKGTIVRPETYEQVDQLFSDFIKYCAQEKKKGVVVWDSLVALTSEKMLAKGKEKLAYRATAIQELIESYIAQFSKLGITLLVINQVRDKVNIDMFASTKGEGAMADTEYNVPGGRAHKFWAFQSLMLAKGQKWKDKSDETKAIFKGRLNRIIPTKNKFGRDRQEVQVVYIPEIGYSNILTIIDDLKSAGYITGQGYYRMKIPGIDKQIPLNKLFELLVTEDEVLDKIYNTIFEKLVEDYKYYDKVDKFDKEMQKEAIRLDAIKHLKFYNKITQENPELLND